ncbi:hypothetical protein, partial [Micromonospora noduli]|uniref:hypothetical protein n=1 Tax=Micromonospora noduli TaxID=709876 RepID=UPI0014756189
DEEDDDDIDIKHLSPELEIQELKQTTNGSPVPIISDVRTLSGDDLSWDKKSDSNGGQSSESFPKIPKTLSVSVTKIPPPDYSLKEQSVDPVE